MVELLLLTVSSNLSTPEGVSQIYSRLNELHQSIKPNRPLFLRLDTLLLPYLDPLL